MSGFLNCFASHLLRMHRMLTCVGFYVYMFNTCPTFCAIVVDNPLSMVYLPAHQGDVCVLALSPDTKP